VAIKVAQAAGIEPAVRTRQVNSLLQKTNICVA